MHPIVDNDPRSLFLDHDVGVPKVSSPSQPSPQSDRVDANGRPAVIVIGEVLVDRFDDGHEVVGGAPMNVAWNLRGMGLDPWFVSAVGDDSTGNHIADVMKTFGLRTDGLQTNDRPTGYVEVKVIEGEPHYDIRRDVAYDHVDAETAIRDASAAGLFDAGTPTDSGSDALEDGISNRGILYHGSLCYRAADTRRTIDRMKSEFTGDVFFDINIRDGHFQADWLDDLMRGVTILKCNWDEIRLLSDQSSETNASGTSGESRDTASDVEAMVATAGRVIQRYDLRCCYLTAGADGAHYIGRNGQTHSVETPHIATEDFGDAVGAGDAFASRTIAGHINGESPERILESAVGHAARVCTLRGATTTDRSFYPQV